MYCKPKYKLTEPVKRIPEKKQKRNQIHITITGDSKESIRTIKIEILRAVHTMNRRMNKNMNVIINCVVIPCERKGKRT